MPHCYTKIKNEENQMQKFHMVSIKDYIKRTVFILLSAAVIETVLLFLVWCIPDGFLKEHVESAWEIFNLEGIEKKK